MFNSIKNNQLKFRLWLAAVLLGLAQTAVALTFEKPEYTVVHTEGDIEYRLYKAYYVSESVVVAEDGDYRNAGQEGVDRILAYIRGDNRRVDAVDSEKIRMTLPIEQSMSAEGWRVSMKLPEKYTPATAPVPNDERISHREVPSRLMAVLRYSGRWTQENFTGRMDDLSRALNKHAVQPIGDMEMALYNPPVTPPFLRRNEVMIEVGNLPETAADMNAIRTAAND